MRGCSVYINDPSFPNDSFPTKIWETGIFHKWVEKNDEVFALVELRNGKVVLVDIDMFQFGRNVGKDQ